ncbi:pyridoxamine 5'-phosphate oxidase family protein [Escherichia coli]|uniref:pyridoxamine 5'-phosphate oxidase family protein n=1 Tax=Escherichia coli TaxID=562 RepID=UPI0038B30F80
MSNPEHFVDNMADIINIIKTYQICRIAINDTPAPYIVPVNFGYEFQDNRCTIWFHGARTGKKMRLLRKAPLVSLEMDGSHKLIKAEEACDYSYAYTSVIASGVAEIVQNHDEMKHGLDMIMQQVEPVRTFNYREDMLKAVCVVRIDCHTLTCRQHKL